jgi:hypothetical protein
MNRIIATVLALTLLGATAAEARRYGDRYYGPGPKAAWGAPGYFKWKRGDYFRPGFGPGFGRQAYIRDWQRYGLRRPPVGYNWIGYNNNYLLVALATGLIADVVLANSYPAYGYGYRY